MMLRLYRWVVYLRRGYGSWVGFLISLATLVTASYQPVYNSLHIVRILAPNLFLWAAEVTALALLLCWVVGRWDYWKGTVGQEGTVGARSNPATVDQFRWMKLMAEGKMEEAAKIVEKWAS